MSSLLHHAGGHPAGPQVAARLHDLIEELSTSGTPTSAIDFLS